MARYLARHIWNSAGKTIKAGHEYKEPKEVGLFGWEAEEGLGVGQQTPEDIMNTFIGIARRDNKLVDKRKAK